MTMAQHTATAGPIDPYAISLIRTIVPVVWGHAIAWLVSLGIPASLLDSYRAIVVEALAAVLTAGWYALWRWIELKLPAEANIIARIASVVALGHPAKPVYVTTAPAAHAQVIGPTG
jgi:uncharacterized membrane protein